MDMFLENDNIEKKSADTSVFELHNNDACDRESYSVRLSEYCAQYQEHFLHTSQCMEAVSYLVETYRENPEDLLRLYNDLEKPEEKLQAITDVRFDSSLSEDKKSELLLHAQSSLNEYIEYKSCSALALTELEDTSTFSENEDKGNPWKTVGVTIAAAATCISAVNPENVERLSTITGQTELLGRYEMQENEKKKRINIAETEQESLGNEPPNLDTLNEIMKDKGVTVSFSEKPFAVSSDLYTRNEPLENKKTYSEDGDLPSSKQFIQNYNDIIFSQRKGESASPSLEDASENVFQRATFTTIPFHKFESEHDIEHPDHARVASEIKSEMHKKSETNRDELTDTAPYSTDHINTQREKIFAISDAIIDSGDNFKVQDVKHGDIFVRICADNDQGVSPFFTKQEEIAEVAFQSPDGSLHINDAKFREKFSLPQTSKLEQCQIFEANKDFRAYCSEISPSVECFEAIKHSGGAEQTIILDRDNLTLIDSIPVISHDEDSYVAMQELNNR